MQVLIADPQPTVRHALSVWISGQPGWVVIGEADDAIQLLGKLNQISPRVVILDHELPALPLKVLVRQLRKLLPDLIIILLTNDPLGHPNPDTLDVDYIVSKIDPPNHLLETIFKTRGKIVDH